MSRKRTFAVRGALAAVALIGLGLWSFAASGAAPQSSGLLVTVGDVTDTTAVLWVRGPTAAPVAVELTSGESVSRRNLVIEPSPARDRTGRTKLSALTPGTRHEYRVHAGGVAVSGHFVTAPPPDRAAPLRLPWSADVGARGFCRRPDVGYAVFEAMASPRPDRFLLLGDTIYADHRCPGDDVVPGADFVAHALSGFHAKHRYNRENAAVQRFLERTSHGPDSASTS